MFDLEQWLKQYGTMTVIGVIIGAILTKLIPYLWAQLGRALARIGKSFGGRLAFHEFQSQYLDWIVTELRELKLTGIVSYDDAKKPQLEQVFVSVDMSTQRDRSQTVERIREHISSLLIGEAFSASSILPGISTINEELISKIANLLAFTEIPSNLSDLEHLIERSILSEAGNRVAIQLLILKGYLILRATAQRIYFRFRGEKPDTFRQLSVRNTRDMWKFYTSNLLNEDDSVQFKRMLHRYSRIAILGMPGSGKTTLLQYVALAYSREKCGDAKLRRRGILKERLSDKKWRLPIFLPLSEVASYLANVDASSGNFSMLDILSQRLPQDFKKEYGEIASNYFTQQLKKGNCIILLDGLDEVPTDEDFNAVVRAIESLALVYKHNQFMVTSRIAGWRSGVGADFQVFYVNDLNDEQVNTFIDSWYSAVELNATLGRLEDESSAERAARNRRASQRADELKRTLEENVGIRRLATNPMLLSIVALVHRSLATLPRERSKLYAECSKILLEQWDYSRGVRVDDTGLKLEQKEAMARRLAIAFHTGEIGDKGGGREASYAQVLQIIASLLPGLGRAPDEAPRLLQRLIERSGIITERRRGVLAFAHLTFQEYFSAQYLALGERLEHRDFLLDNSRLMSDWWHEVVLLYSGLLSDSSEFINLIYHKPDDDLCQQKLQLAGSCLSEAIEVKNTEIRQSIVARLISVRSGGEIADVVQVTPPDLADYLLRECKSTDWFEYAAKCTVAEDANPYEKLLSGLRDQRSLIRRAALVSFNTLSDIRVPESIEQSIIALMSDNDSQVRLLAIKAASHVENDEFLEVLIHRVTDALKDSDDDISSAAAQTITIIGERKRLSPEIFNVSRLLQNEESNVRNIAAKVFFALDYDRAPEQIDLFLNLLADNDDDVRYTAKKSLEKTLSRSSSEVLIGKTVSLAENGNTVSRVASVSALGESSADIALRYHIAEVLIRRLKDDDIDVQETALASLQQLAGKGLLDSVMAIALAMLKQRDLSSQINALRVISVMKPFPISDESFDLILSSSRSNNRDLCQAATTAFGIADSTEKKSVAAKRLVQLSRHTRSNIASSALATLGQLEVVTEDVVAALEDGIDRKQTHVKNAAIQATKVLGTKINSQTILGKLIRILGNDRILDLNYLRDRLGMNFALPNRTRREACDALICIAMDSNAPMIINKFSSIVKSKRTNLSMKIYTLSALAKFGGRVASEKVADELSALFTLDPELAIYWLQRWSMFERRIYSRFEKGSFIMRGHNRQDPMTTTLKMLSDKSAENHLAEFVNSRKDSLRILGLQLTEAMSDTVDLELLTSGLVSALKDRSESVRLSAINAVAAFRSNALNRDLILQVQKRLADEDSEMRNQAWRILVNFNKSNGFWKETRI